MFRALLFMLPLSACAQFPQVDAVLPDNLPARPAFLTPAELAAANVAGKDIPAAPPDEAGQALQTRADALRNR